MKNSLSLLFVVAFAGLAVFVIPVGVEAQQASEPNAKTAEAGGISETLAPEALQDRRKRNLNLITVEEVREAGVRNALEAVSRLRPGWLRQRGVSSINRQTAIVVYQDEMRLGGIQALRQIHTSAIGSLAYLDGTEATQRFGSNHGSGAILVKTQR